MNKKRRSKQAVPAAPPAPSIEETQRRYQPHLEACAHAAVRCAGMLRNALGVRAEVIVPAANALWAARANCMVPLEKWPLVTKEKVDFTDTLLKPVMGSTQALRMDLEIFNDQIASLETAYQIARAVHPIAAVRALRAISKRLSTALDSTRPLWAYVLRAWELRNPEAVKLARWLPDADSKDFTFDDTTHVWKHEPSGATIEIKSTFALAK